MPISMYFIASNKISEMMQVVLNPLFQSFYYRNFNEGFQSLKYI